MKNEVCLDFMKEIKYKSHPENETEDWLYMWEKPYPVFFKDSHNSEKVLNLSKSSFSSRSFS